MENFETLLNECRKGGIILSPPKPKKFSEIKCIFFAWDFAARKENQKFVENLVRCTFPKGYKIEIAFIWQDTRKGKKQVLQHIKFSNK